MVLRNVHTVRGLRSKGHQSSFRFHFRVDVCQWSYLQNTTQWSKVNVDISNTG